MLKIKNKRRVNQDAGFTLVEVVIAAGIIATVIAAFTVFLTNIAQLQTTSSMTRTASRLVSAELEKISGAKWDDLMSPPSAGSGSGCALTATRKSLQIVQTGPITITSDGLPISITRTVVWAKTLAQITNAVGNGITVTYSAVNSFIPGQIVSIYNTIPTSYNLTNLTVTSSTATQFTVSNSAVGTFSIGGWAGASVYCLGVKDSSDLKVVNVTGVWHDGLLIRSKSFTATESKYTFGIRVK